MNHSSESSTKSTKNAVISQATPDINVNKDKLLLESRSGSQNKPLNVNTGRDILTLSKKSLSTPASASKFKTIHEKNTSIVATYQRKSEKSIDVIVGDTTDAKSTLRVDTAPASPKTKTTEQIIAQSMAELAKINEENSVSDKSGS